MTDLVNGLWMKTGEHRPPQCGEWFLGYGDKVSKAMFDFTAQEFDILIPISCTQKEADHD